MLFRSSSQTADDLERLAHLYQAVNIKLDKCGGLTDGLRLAKRASALGRDVMVGNMLGSSLAMAPAFLLGQYCSIVHLDGPIFLKSDCPPGAPYRSGHIARSEQRRVGKGSVRTYRSRWSPHPTKKKKKQNTKT